MAMGSDEITAAKAFRLLLLLVFGAFIVFTIANIPALSNWAIIFGFMTVVSFLAIVAGKFKKVEIIDTVTEEPASTRPAIIQSLGPYAVWITAIFFVLFSIFTITRTQQAIVAAPTFSVATLAADPLFSSIITGLVAIPENQFFFGFIFPTIAAILIRQFGLPSFAGVLGGMIITPFIFMGYHSLVYSGNLVAGNSVLLFGAVNCILVWVFRSLIVSDAWHFSNNFIIAFLRSSGIGLAVTQVVS